MCAGLKGHTRPDRRCNSVLHEMRRCQRVPLALLYGLCGTEHGAFPCNVQARRGLSGDTQTAAEAGASVCGVLM